MPTVPACRDCNGGANLDEEYVISRFMGRHDIDAEGEFREVFDRVTRALENERKRGFAHAYAHSVNEVRVVSEAGLYLGTSAVAEIDNVRVERVMSKILRGLYYSETRRKVPTGYKVRTVLVDALAQNDLEKRALPFAEYLAQGRPRPIGSSFGYIRRPAPVAGEVGEVWQFLFFKKVSVIGFLWAGESPLDAQSRNGRLQPKRGENGEGEWE